MAAILDTGRRWRTQFWKRTIQWLFHQNVVLIEQMVSDKKIFMGISHRVLCQIKFDCGAYVLRDFLRTLNFAYFDLLCKLEKGGMKFKKNLLLWNSYFLSWRPSWIQDDADGHNFGREPSNDYFIKILFLLSKWFQRRRFLWEFPIGSNVKLTKMAAMTKHRNFFKWPKLLYFKPESAQIWTV
jgi:hypothetical protein